MLETEDVDVLNLKLWKLRLLRETFVVDDTNDVVNRVVDLG